MSNLSNINLRKQWKDFWFKDPKPVTPERIEKKEAKCLALFKELEECSKKHGWNDNQCQGVVKPKYERCVMKRDKLIQAYQESSL